MAATETLSVWRIAWRGGISLHNMALGATLADGRWHACAQQLPVVYAASTRALAQLEKRVHCNGVPPKDMVLLRLALGAHWPLEDATPTLPETWRGDMAATQAVGTAWARSLKSVGLWVPSYVVPQERNLVLNPRHPQFAAITIHVEADPFVFDPRMF